MGEHNVVTAVLPFLAENAGDPPDRRVIEQEAFDGPLREIDGVVEAADMRELMQQEIFELFGGKSGEQACGHQDYGAQDAGHHGHIQTAGGEQGDGGGNAEAFGESGEAVLPERRRGRGAAAAQALRGGPAEEVSQAEERHAGQPEGHEPAHRGLGAFEQGDRAGVCRRKGGSFGQRGESGEDGEAGGVFRQQDQERREEHGRHGEHCHTCQAVAGGRFGAARGKEQGDGEAFPEKVEQGGAEGFDERGIHWFSFLSYSSISFRISASSARDALLAESAPTSRLRAEPPKARCSRSPASCRCVHSRGRVAA